MTYIIYKYTLYVRVTSNYESVLNTDNKLNKFEL
jgi:hypothetical protein